MTTAVDTDFSKTIRRIAGPSAKRVETFDVAIIGSSVCGAALAAILSEAGMSTAVITDRHGSKRRGSETAFCTSELPGCPPVCGAEQSAGAFFKIVSSGGKTLNVLKNGNPLSFFSIPHLETHFTVRAVHAGARVYKGPAVTLCQESGCWVINVSDTAIKSRIVVGAGGWDSVVRKAVDAPFNSKDLNFAVGCIARIDEENGVKINLFENGRFCRIIKYGSRANAAVFGPAADVITPRLIFEKIMKSELAAISSVLSYWTAFVPSPASAQFFSLPSAGKNWILLGEAAGHVHPVNGESLRYALAGAQFAAQAIECGEPRVFHSLWRDDYGRELEEAVKLKNKMNKWRRSAELVFSAASKSSYIKNFISSRFFS